MDPETRRKIDYLPMRRQEHGGVFHPHSTTQNPSPPVQQPISGLSADAVRKVVTKLRRIPNMAEKQGANSPTVWMKLGECIADLEMLLGEAD